MKANETVLWLAERLREFDSAAKIELVARRFFSESPPTVLAERKRGGCHARPVDDEAREIVERAASWGLGRSQEFFFDVRVLDRRGQLVGKLIFVQADLA